MLYHCNNVYEKVSQCFLIRTSSVLLRITLRRLLHKLVVAQLTINSLTSTEPKDSSQ